MLTPFSGKTLITHVDILWRNPVYDLILARLQGLRKIHKGWEAQCPAHEDSSPSLSVAIGDKGQLLMWCFAGCRLDEIVTRLNVGVSDLFPEQAMDLHDVHERAMQMLRAQEHRREQHVGAWEDGECWATIRHARGLATRLGNCDESWDLLEKAAALETMMLKT